MKTFAVALLCSVLLGCSAVRGSQPVAPVGLYLRIAPPPHLPMMVFPPDHPGHIEPFSIEIRKGDFDSFPI